MAHLRSIADDVAGLRRFVFHVPAVHNGHTPPGPCCVTQWYFDDLELLEAALQPGGAMQTAVDFISARIDQCTLLQQAMAVRKFRTPHQHAFDTREERCTYLVSYEGEADDFNAWLTHYLTHHPPLMRQLPGIRELEIYTRIDYRSGLKHARSTAMQRNKVVFDDAESLGAALASAVRARMKEDFDAFPPYTGATPHYPMHSIYGNLTREH
ncbi:EthD family reductase [Burkholderia sp. Ac-20365]|uniref:EthD family reductase n=1 Tax=Burkholderia sp. Ac-20365 TaxID=2703897 RepID=UPI00197B3BC1|nr:EthD family reductase [Burkholderia sp. Ac-20365]MBN3759445.1 EthD family reductase [Burkholderia sp. Ac-20365]